MIWALTANVDKSDYSFADVALILKIIPALWQKQAI
jgi:hypothetical protein